VGRAVQRDRAKQEPRRGTALLAIGCAALEDAVAARLTLARTPPHNSAGQAAATVAALGEAAAPGWKSLQDNDTWQDVYFTNGPDQRELAFWLGQG
jgi:hypothetical protein